MSGSPGPRDRGTPLDGVVGHACLLSSHRARLSVALPGRSGVRSGLLRFSQTHTVVVAREFLNNRTVLDIRAR